MTKGELLSQLNTGQRSAVEYIDGPQLVIAGAGSGKTRVLTYKIAYLLQNGMKPWNIMALTFTNKAANEMKERIGRLVGSELSQYLQMGTFHSIFSRILRMEAQRIGYSNTFTIYDETDSRSLIKSIVKEKELDDKIYKPAAVHNRISMAKNHIITAEEYAMDREVYERDRQARMPAIGQIYIAYQQRLVQANAMDFDDLLMLTYRLFKDNEDIRRKYAEKYQYVLVDEYQDTNRVQQQIVEQLTRENQRVCVVGDDAQSIYAFRGANIDNILDFNKIYPNSKLFKLEQNYRSTQRIVQAANSLIKHNQRQIPKNVFSENAEGECLVLKPAYSDKEEAAIVCKDIKRIKSNENGEYSDFAILYRTNAQSRAFEEECMKQGIPYKIYGGLSFYQRKEIKDIVAYFRVVANPNDEEAIKRIINYPARGIGNTTMQKVIATSQEHNTSIWNVIANMNSYPLNLGAAARKNLTGFVMNISAFIERMPLDDAYTLGADIIQKMGIHADLYSSNEADYLSRQENLEEFMAALQDFVNGQEEQGLMHEAHLVDFLQDVSLQTDKESDDGAASRVSMMTVHSAKGLEFPTVFVVGMEENIFPSQMAMESMKELEEERRLLYVAITRAEKHCILTCAKNRWRYGKLEMDVPSRFLNDIDTRLLRVEGGADAETSRGRSDFGGRYSRFHEDSVNVPYTGSRPHGNDYPEYSPRMQNSRPVAGQFRADLVPKITRPHHEESIDPLSPAFRRQVNEAARNPRMAHGARAAGFRQAADSVVPEGFKRVSKISSNTSAVASSSSKIGSQASLYDGLSEGSVIEHQRFGVGTVTKLEGVGDNAKATVEFRNTGTKQLLLKFAKFKVIG